MKSSSNLGFKHGRKGKTLSVRKGKSLPWGRKRQITPCRRILTGGRTALSAASWRIGRIPAVPSSSRPRRSAIRSTRWSISRRTSGSSHPTRRRPSSMRIPGSAFRNSGKTSVGPPQREGQVYSPDWSIVPTAARSSISAQPKACGRIRSFFDAPITNQVAESVPSISFGTWSFKRSCRRPLEN